MTIRGDSTEYELLKIWCETLPFYEEPKSVKTCEIGVREEIALKRKHHLEGFTRFYFQ